MQEAANVLKEDGRIVNISTDGTHLSFPGATVYLGSKGALEQYTKGLAQELAPRGVTVNTVSPGFTETGMMTDQFRQIGSQMSPLKRLGLPKDNADVVAFVVSEEVRWLTGQNIHAGGGIVMWQDAEKVRQLRSRIAQKLNVPKHTPRLFARCGLADSLFEHPEALLPSAPIWKIPIVYCE